MPEPNLQELITIPGIGIIYILLHKNMKSLPDAE